MPTLAINKRAKFDYNLLETYEAGLVLFGHEVKSVKTGRVSLKGAYVTTKQVRGKNVPELYLTNAHIPPYQHAGKLKDYDPTRPRKLLLHKNQITRLVSKKQEQGLTLIPVKLYTKRSLIKLEFALGKGKKKHDKREAIKKRDLERKVRTLTKRKK